MKLDEAIDSKDTINYQSDGSEDVKVTSSNAKSISISEFFEANRQMLGFSSLTRNILITIKEAVDNALDAAEDHNILVDINIIIKELSKKLFKITIEDNGPGIPKNKVGSVFGKLLYGSKFHERKQKRGQQGLGISACVLNSQIDTNTPVYVETKLKEEQWVHSQYIAINIVKNEPAITHYKKLKSSKISGVKIEIKLNGKYVSEGKKSVKYYLEQVSLMNPWANISLEEPNGTIHNYPRRKNLIVNANLAKLYPKTTPLGTFSRLIKQSNLTISEFLEQEIEGINQFIIKDLFLVTGIKERIYCKALTVYELKCIYETLKLYDYPINESTIALIGEKELLEGLNAADYSFAVSTTSSAISFANTIGKLEMALVYGKDLPKEQKIEVCRFVNKVPLLLQPGSCLLNTAVTKLNWKNYGLDHTKGELPIGPVRLLVHLAGYKIPFNSEAKESVSEIPILQTMFLKTLKKLALKLSKQLIREQFRILQLEKFKLMQKHIPVLIDSFVTLNYETPNNQISLLSQVMNGLIYKKVDKEYYFANYTASSYHLYFTNKEVYIVEPGEIKIYNTDSKFTSNLPIYQLTTDIDWTVGEFYSYKSILSTIPFDEDPMLNKLENIAKDLYEQVKSGKVPTITIRVRSKQNLILHEKGYWYLGNSYSIKTAKKVAGMVQIIRLLKLIDLFNIQLKANKTASIREVYYNTERWGPDYKFDQQADSDSYLEILEILTGYSRELLGVFPEARGQIAGPLIISEMTKRGIKQTDCQLDLPDKGGGIPIPFSVESLKLVEIRGKFVLAIESSGAFCRLVENGFDSTYNAILVCLNGQPTRSTKELLKMFSDRNLPIYAFLDNDNWSLRIFGSCAYGSIKTAHLSHRFSVPNMIHLGLTFDDVLQYKLPTDKLRPVDLEGFEQLLEDPRYSPEIWHDVIRRQMIAKVKAEQQSLAALGINFVTDTYLPEKLRNLGVI
jgi:DNA topoisomerase VI B subunit